MVFDFDSDALRPAAPPKLEAFVDHLEVTLSTRIVISGHADQAGASPYNVVLSVRRAETVQRALEYRGIDGNRVVIAIYGEDAPRRRNHAEDRRVTIMATDDVATAVMWDQPVSVAEIDGPRVEQVSRR